MKKDTNFWPHQKAFTPIEIFPTTILTKNHYLQPNGSQCKTFIRDYITITAIKGNIRITIAFLVSWILTLEVRKSLADC